MLIERGDVALIRFPFTDAKGSKLRPVFVATSTEFNHQHHGFVAVMITSKSEPERWEFAIRQWQQAGLAHPSFVRLGRLFSTDNQFVYRVIGRVPDDEARSILDMVRPLFQ